MLLEAALKYVSLFPPSYTAARHASYFWYSILTSFNTILISWLLVLFSIDVPLNEFLTPFHRPVKGRQKLMGEICVGRNEAVCMASKEWGRMHSTWESLKPLSKLCIGRNKTECAWQQVQSYALLRWGFGISVPFISIFHLHKSSFRLLATLGSSWYIHFCFYSVVNTTTKLQKNKVKLQKPFQKSMCT